MASIHSSVRRFMLLGAITLAPGFAASQDLSKPDQPVQERFALKVLRHPKAAKQMTQLHSRIAQKLTAAKLPPPQDRIKYFRNLYVASSPDVTGWAGYIVNVEPIEGGYVVTLEVSAKHDHFADSARFYETYSIVGNDIAYVGYFAPATTSRIIVGL